MTIESKLQVPGMVTAVPKDGVTLEDLQAIIPSRKGAITQEAVDIINASMSEPEFQGESLLQTAVTYGSVLKGVKASIPEYLNAIRFCSYMLSMNDNYTEAYKRTFYHRDFVKERMNKPTDSNEYKELTFAASRYRRSKIVVDILTLSQVPMYLLFRGYQYEAIGVLHQTMHSAKMDRDKINAAKELLAATKMPENMKIELDVGVKDTDAMKSLNEQLNLLAMNQKRMLENGYNIKDIQKVSASINNAEPIEGEFE